MLLSHPDGNQITLGPKNKPQNDQFQKQAINNDSRKTIDRIGLIVHNKTQVEVEILLPTTAYFNKHIRRSCDRSKV